MQAGLDMDHEASKATLDSSLRQVWNPATSPSTRDVCNLGYMVGSSPTYLTANPRKWRGVQ